MSRVNNPKHNKKKKYKINKKRMATAIAVLVLVIFLVAKLISSVGGGAAKKLTDEGLTHAEQFSDCIIVNGIDVSEHQGKINWKKVKASGVDFVFIRAGYRGATEGDLYVDETFSANVHGAKKAGLMVGAYYYSQATTTAEAEEEARAMLDIIKDYDMDLPVVIDYEIYPGGRLEQVIKSGNMNVTSMYHDIVLAFCAVVEDAGYDSGVYGNTDMFTHYMDASLIDDETNLWVAEFGSSCSLNAGYRFWQCSESADVAGIDTPVDHDILYLESATSTPVWYYKTAGKRVSMSKCKVSLKKDTVRFKRKGSVVKATVTDLEGKRMREDMDYSINFVNNTSRGTGYAIVRGINGYRDIIIAPYTIK